jgi:NADH-quinone oxidoreductase subunit G
LDRFHHLADVMQALAGERADLAAAAAGSGPAARLPAGTGVPRQPHRYSGRTAMNANVSVHEPKTSVDEESPLRFSMEGDRPPDPGALFTYSWAPGWNSNQSIFKFQSEVGGALRGGGAGVRLPVQAAAEAFASPAREAIPERFQTAQRLLAVPLQEVFGSDELSARATAVRDRAPVPYVVLGPEDAERLGIAAGDGVTVGNGDGRESFRVRIEPAMSRGAVGLVQGMTGRLWLAPGTRLEVAVDPDYVPPPDRMIARG